MIAEHSKLHFFLALGKRIRFMTHYYQGKRDTRARQILNRLFSSLARGRITDKNWLDCTFQLSNTGQNWHFHSRLAIEKKRLGLSSIFFLGECEILVEYNRLVMRHILSFFAQLMRNRRNFELQKYSEIILRVFFVEKLLPLRIVYIFLLPLFSSGRQNIVF